MGDFFESIYGGLDGRVQIMTRDPETGELNSGRWFDVRRIDRMDVYVDMRTEEDVYCSVAAFPQEHRSTDVSGSKVKAVWADADTCAPEKFRLAPSIIVSTSEGHWHCWWLLDEPTDAHEAQVAAQKIAYAHRDDGCDNGWTVSKLLRVPGTSNLKREKPEKVTAEYTGALYTLDEILAAYADIETASRQATSEEVPEILSTSQMIDLEQRVVAGSSFEDLYTLAPPAGTSWYPRLFRLQHDLFRAGCTPQEVFNLCKRAACNKFERDNRPDSDLWKTVRNAWGEYASEAEQVDEPPILSSVPTPEFLTEDEKNLLPRTFVDEYVEYVGSKTDAAPKFSRTLGFQILSCVYGDRCFLPLRYGKGFLNLWTLILAPTTSRKSTAKRIALDVLHGYENQALMGERIDIGSETTKEGLAKILGERDGKVSLLATDEVAGLFKEAYTKNYQAGTLQAMTDMYEGDVPVVIRAGKDAGQKNRATTRFNFLGVGVATDVAEILTKKDFESGFLARMLWCVGGPTERKKGADRPRWRDLTGAKRGGDADLARIVLELKTGARVFSPSQPTPITMDKDAEDRFSDWMDFLVAHAKTTVGEALVDANVKRLGDQTLKCSALLAAHEGKTVIQMPHVLYAINQAREWYDDMITMLHAVSANAFERTCDEVERYVSSGEAQTRQRSDVNRKFPMRPQDINDVLTALKIQGRVRINGETIKVLAA